LAHHHHARGSRSFARDRLRRMLIERTARAGLLGFAQPFDRAWRDVGHLPGKGFRPEWFRLDLAGIQIRICPETKNRSPFDSLRTERRFSQRKVEGGFPMPVGASTGQAKQTRARTIKSKAPDAIKLLKADHDEVEALFAQYEKQKKRNGGQKPEL